MRDEVLAEWKDEQGTPILHIYCHFCGGFVLDTASMREAMSRREMSLVLEAIAYGDREMLDKTAKLGKAEIFVHFRKAKPYECKIEPWGQIYAYSMQTETR